MAEVEYVRKDVFDVHLQRLEQRIGSLEKRMDDRFDKMQTLMEKTLIEMKADNAKLQAQIEQGFALMNERIEKNLAQYEAITSKIEGDVNTLNARVDSVQHRRGLDIAWTGIAVGAVVGLIQMFTK